MAENINIPYLLKTANGLKKGNVLYPINIAEAVISTKSRGELSYEEVRKMAFQTMLKFTQEKDEKGKSIMDKYAVMKGRKRSLYPAKIDGFVQALWDFYEVNTVSDESGRIKIKDGRNSKSSISQSLEAIIKGKKITKNFEKRMNKNKSGYFKFIKNVAMEFYCGLYDLDASQIHNLGLNRTLLFDLNETRSVAVEFAKKNLTHFKKYLVKNGDIFNKTGERVIEEEAKIYFGSHLLNRIEVNRKRMGIQEKPKKITLDVKALADDDGNEDDDEPEESSPLAVIKPKVIKPRLEPDEEEEKEKKDTKPKAGKHPAKQDKDEEEDIMPRMKRPVEDDGEKENYKRDRYSWPVRHDEDDDRDYDDK